MLSAIQLSGLSSGLAEEYKGCTRQDAQYPMWDNHVPSALLRNPKALTKLQARQPNARTASAVGMRSGVLCSGGLHVILEQLTKPHCSLFGSVGLHLACSVVLCSSRLHDAVRSYGCMSNYVLVCIITPYTGLLRSAATLFAHTVSCWGYDALGILKCPTRCHMYYTCLSVRHDNMLLSASQYCIDAPLFFQTMQDYDMLLCVLSLFCLRELLCWIQPRLILTTISHHARMHVPYYAVSHCYLQHCNTFLVRCACAAMFAMSGDTRYSNRVRYAAHNGLKTLTSYGC